MKRGSHRALAVLVLVAAFVHAARGVLHAHAMLVASEPAAESVVVTSPTRVRLLFSEEIEPSLAHVSVVASDGHVEQLARLAIASNDVVMRKSWRTVNAGWAAGRTRRAGLGV